MTTTRMVEVSAGFYEGGNSDNEKNSKTERIFVEKRWEVVPEDKLAALFRRDWDLCSYPVVRTRNVNAEATVLI